MILIDSLAALCTIDYTVKCLMFCLFFLSFCKNETLNLKAKGKFCFKSC